MTKVVAMEKGFYGGTLRRIGAIFDMDETKWKKADGKPVTPSWVKVVANEGEGRRVAADAAKAAEKKQVDGAHAASGGKVAKDKVDALSERVHR